MRKLLWTVFLSYLWLGINPALAQSPMAYVRGILDSAMAIQNNASLNREERKQEIHQIIRSNFDFNAMARDVLGSNYNRLSSGQRQEFIDTFRYLFQDSYTRMVLNYLKNEKIHYKKASQSGGEARVDTVIERPNESIPVTYLVRTSGGLKLYDVIVDDVSILNTYRRTFSRVIRDKSFNFLIGRMKEQRRAIE